MLKLKTMKASEIKIIQISLQSYNISAEKFDILHIMNNILKNEELGISFKRN